LRASKTKSLVVPTYDAESWLFELLCKSISKFVYEPTTIAVYYCNDIDNFSNWKSWFDSYCLPYLSLHRVIVIDQKDILDCSDSAYVRQNVCKFHSCYVVDTPYVVALDSKNFFFKRCSLDDILPTFPSLDIYAPSSFDYKQHCLAAERFGYHKPLPLLKMNICPYIMSTDVLKDLISEVGGIHELNNWWQTDTGKGLGFLRLSTYEIYEIARGNVMPGQVVSNNSTLFPESLHELSLTSMLEWVNIPDKNVFVSGIHQTVLHSIGEQLAKRVIFELVGDDVLPNHSLFVNDVI
jgi:hypothetical protein